MFLIFPFKNYLLYLFNFKIHLNNKQTTKSTVEFYTNFIQKGAVIFITLFQKHDVDVVLGISNAKKT